MKQLRGLHRRATFKLKIYDASRTVDDQAVDVLSVKVFEACVSKASYGAISSTE